MNSENVEADNCGRFQGTTGIVKGLRKTTRNFNQESR
jgi:hypothetical protein